MKNSALQRKHGDWCFASLNTVLEEIINIWKLGCKKRIKTEGLRMKLKNEIASPTYA
jgi:hypothetical protein